MVRPRLHALSVLICTLLMISNGIFAQTPTPTRTVQPDSARSGKKTSPVQELTQAEQLERLNRKYQALEAFAMALNLLESQYVDENSVKPEELVQKAIKGMLTGLDPHTSFLPKEQLGELNSDTTGRFGGIGVTINQSSGKLEIQDLVLDAPAAKAGLQKGDVISGVDKVEVNSANLEDILNRLRGAPGSTVLLEIQRPGEGVKPFGQGRQFLIRREIIRTSSVTHQALAEGVAYVKISIFQEDTAEQLDKVLKIYEGNARQPFRGLVLDLRDNPGGRLDAAVKVVSLFVRSGIVVTTWGRELNISRERSRGEDEMAQFNLTHPFMPMVVLINENSASASEIVAGALQDHERAIVMGSQSYGKASVQQIVTLPTGDGMKFTIARYYTPLGRSIQNRGITPDVVVPVPPATATGSNKVKREADLEHRLDAKPLLPDAATGLEGEMESWTPVLKSDVRLRAAFAWLRTWGRMSQEAKAQPPVNR